MVQTFAGDRMTHSSKPPQQESHLIPRLLQEPDARRSFSSLSHIVDAIRSPLLVLDEGLRVSLANRAFYRLFAIAPAETIGKQLLAIGSHRLNAEELGSLFTSIEAGSPTIEDRVIEITLPELGRRVLQLTATRIEEEPSNGCNIVVTMDDITQRKRDEAESISAKWRAERAGLRQAQLLAVASHELRQPMQALSLMRAILAKMLQKKQDDEALNLLAQIKETADAMSGVLGTLLDINQLEAGVVQPEKENFSIGTLLQRLRVEFTYHAQAQGLGWRVVPCELFVHSDPHLLEQIIRNLLSNAVKYTSTGKLLLGCRRRGDKVRIEVWDTGCGIPQAEISSIFKKFRRLDNSTGQRERGFGLGLAIVRRFSDLLGHMVYIHSRPGAGSVFAIEVPLAPKAQGAQSQHEALSPMPSFHRSATILVIESDTKTREMLDRLFTGEGYRVLAAAEGKEAATLALATTKPDIIVAGYQLQVGSTGPQIVTQVREALDRKIPAIILTGNVSTDSVREIAKRNCVQRTKPADADELLHLIQSLLTERKVATEQTKRLQTANDKRHTERPTIFVVDDDCAVREGMRELFRDDERWSIETYPSGEMFLESLRSRRNGVLVVDSQMPGMSGIDLLERLDFEGHALPAIMVTGHADVRLAVRAMKVGVVAFLEKPVQFDELMGHIEQALERARDSAVRCLWHDTATKLIGKLTAREREVMTLVIEGNANKQMAYVLGINQRTVETHRATIMKKLGARTLSDLIHTAIAAAPRHA
jgi:two-component system, chemotaxis family, CheB/CheR fusion protein